MVGAETHAELRGKMDFLLKQRLVGAIVLVALGVIFIPMLLEGPNKDLVPEMEPLPELTGERSRVELGRFPDAGDVPAGAEVAVLQSDSAIAANPGADLSSPPEEAAVSDIVAPEPKLEPLPVPPQPTAKPESPESEPAKVESAKAESAKAESAKAEPAKAEPAKAEPAKAEPAKAEPAKPAGPLGNWVVQVGSFSSEQNALRLRDKLRKAGFVTQVEKVRVDAKFHYRVRVGPYLERAEADQDLAQLDKQLNLKGRVLSYP
jgi:DedD protein